MAAFTNAPDERLLRALAEQLKMPFMHIARRAEVARSVGDSGESVLISIEQTADIALKLLDSYLLSIQLESLPSLELEPVSVSAVLQDTAHQLHAFAKQYDHELQVDIRHRYQPVMAHRLGLESAFLSLGYAFIESLSRDSKMPIVLGVHRSNNGLVAGVFGEQSLSADALKRGHALYGSARQAMPAMSSSAGAGVFIANSLLSQLQAPLRVSKHNKLTGLASTLLPSEQLVLV